MSTQDELTTTACRAVVRLSPIKKAQFLLNTALALIEDGVLVLHCGSEIPLLICLLAGTGKK